MHQLNLQKINSRWFSNSLNQSQTIYDGTCLQCGHWKEISSNSLLQDLSNAALFVGRRFPVVSGNASGTGVSSWLTIFFRTTSLPESFATGSRWIKFMSAFMVLLCLVGTLFIFHHVQFRQCGALRLFQCVMKADFCMHNRVSTNSRIFCSMASAVIFVVLAVKYWESR